MHVRRRHFVTRISPLLLVLSLVASTGIASEADCRACGFCTGKKDIADDITERLNRYIAQGKSAEWIARREGGTSIIHTPIGRWANRHSEAVSPDPNIIKYKGSGLPQCRFFHSFERSVMINGVCLGTDKLSHVFQQGWEYYKISVRDGKGDLLAERYGEWLEGKELKEAYATDESYFRQQLSGGWVSYGRYGRNASGVISHADLAANRAGLQMYKDIANGRFKNFSDYVSPDFCEEVNLNDYSPRMKKIVERNGRK